MGKYAVLGLAMGQQADDEIAALEAQLPPPPDTQAPHVLSVQVENLAHDRADLVVELDEPAILAVDYGPTPSYGAVASSVPHQTLHRVALVGLQGATTYHYRITATDASPQGNVSVVPDATFRTLDPPDVTPPTVQNLVATVVGDVVTLTWQASDNVAVVACAVLRGGVLQGGVTAPPFTFTQQAPPGTHVYEVVASDAAGLSASATVQVTVVPQAPPAGTAPRLVYGPAPTSGFKRATPYTDATYYFRPARLNPSTGKYVQLGDGERVSGVVTFGTVVVDRYGRVMPTPWPPWRLLLDGVEPASLTVDTAQRPAGHLALTIQVLDAQGKDVGNQTTIVVVNNTGAPVTQTTGLKVAGSRIQTQQLNSSAWAEFDAIAPTPRPLGHGAAMHPPAQSDADRARMTTEKVWWVDGLVDPNTTGLYRPEPRLVRNRQGDVFVQHFYPTSFDDLAAATPVVACHPAFDGPRGIASLTGYAFLVPGLKDLASGHKGWLGISPEGRVLDVDITGEVTTIFGPRSVAGSVQTDHYDVGFNLAQRIAAGEKEFVGDQSGGTLWEAHDVWAKENSPDRLWIADTGHDRLVILDRVQQKITGTIPLADVTSTWCGGTGPWYAVNPQGLHVVQQGQATLVAPIAGAFWVRGSERGTVYVLTTTAALYEYDPATGTTTQRLGPQVAVQKFVYMAVDLKGQIGPIGRVYIGWVHHQGSYGANVGLSYVDPQPVGTPWTRKLYPELSLIKNYAVYGNWNANQDPLVHYPWCIAICGGDESVFAVGGLANGFKVWTAHLGPTPVPDPAVLYAGTDEFVIGRLDEFLGLGAVMGNRAFGHVWLVAPDWKALTTWAQAQPVMHQDLDPFKPPALSAAAWDNALRMLFMQRDRKHFQ